MEFLDELPGDSPTIEYVGGPRSGERDEVPDRPAVIPLAGGEYRRSVQCADDGALRYVWSASES